ncbi:thioredoxin [Nocardia sp. NBC_01503]|uniref:thioredoxin n=1 Tax=Nocardia sp. NBC_01503 TaxID=2975997 RepID=UPI002E7C562A|nr:thioredoxin [Nocardia sp. NBC_01503]WTL33515.1 thioredoxin [Nocardia sp. NBC_01503]
MSITAVTDETFEHEVLTHEGAVLVDFWAEWCPPCRMIAPVLDAIAAERHGLLTIRKLNTDENPSTARDYHIMSAPTLILFRNGEPVRTMVGARSKAKLLAELDEILSASHE